MGPKDCSLLVRRDIGVGGFERLAGDSADKVDQLVMKIAGHGLVVIAIAPLHLGIACRPGPMGDEVVIIAAEGGYVGFSEQPRQDTVTLRRKSRTGFGD